MAEQIERISQAADDAARLPGSGNERQAALLYVQALATIELARQMERLVRLLEAEAEEMRHPQPPAKLRV